MLRTVFFVVSMIALAGALGCAGAQQKRTADSERNLAAAGFDVRPADTPQKLSQLEALPQNKVIARTKDGQTYFMYADATDCKCLYVGSKADYQQYAKLTQQEQIAEDQAEAAEDWDDATWGPWIDAWGPWDPYW